MAGGLYIRSLTLLLYAMSVWVGRGVCCPSSCFCDYGQLVREEQLTENLYITNCSQAGLDYIPPGVPNITQYLDMSSNQLSVVSENRLMSLQSLQYLDLRRNPNLHTIPTMRGLVNLTKVYVDHGPICCIYEVEWERLEGFSRRKHAANVCQATTKYTECDRHLIRIPSIITYALTVFLSLALNPWVLIVTLAHRRRRNDPITLINAHFTISSFLITIYASGILVVGSCFYDAYPYHMEDWLENPGCGVLGYILITGSLACTVFYTLEIIMIFLKVCYPCQQNRHMTCLQLNICVVITWLLCITIASIPFFFGRYNAVGLCLPFYSGDFDFSFKFVLLYTAVTNVTTIINMGMHINVLRLFIKKAKETDEPMCEQRRKENRNLRNTVIITLVVFILISVAEMVFLIMSCIGGNLGQIGREWWARMVILEAVINPLTGPVRKKRFFRDTKVLVSKFRNWINEPPERPKRRLSQMAMDLRNFRDKCSKAKRSKHAPLATDSPSNNRSDEKAPTGKVTERTVVGHEGANNNHHTRQSVYTVEGTSSSAGSTPQMVHFQRQPQHSNKHSMTQLGVSPASQITIITDTSSECASEKSI